MRKFNSILGPAIIILLVIHGITGAFQLMGIMNGGAVWKNVLSWIMVCAVILHIFVGIKLTVDSLLALAKSDKPVFKGNGVFWIRRLSGFALIIFIIYHMIVYMSVQGEAFRLNSFGVLQLTAHILLTASLAIHLIFNIKPLFIALGIADRRFIRDIMIILSIFLCVCAAAFVFYYFRWNILWRYEGSTGSVYDTLRWLI